MFALMIPFLLPWKSAEHRNAGGREVPLYTRAEKRFTERFVNRTV